MLSGEEQIAAAIDAFSSSQRTFQRQLKRYRLREWGMVNGWLCLVVTVTDTVTGAELIGLDHPFNPMHFRNPPTMVADGTEPNPNHVPGDPQSTATRTAFRHDPAEALRQMLVMKLAEAMADA